jgi:predicted nuclease of predicted toxin-antitoxin system
LKFLVDAQLPKSLSELLKQRGYDSIHTLDLPNSNATTDRQIIELSTLEQRIVITKDSDFLESYLISGKPTKLVLVRTGNVSNKILLQLFDKNFHIITAMLQKSNLIELSATEITEHG